MWQFLLGFVLGAIFGYIIVAVLSANDERWLEIMSGGSFDYLCFKEYPELMSSSNLENMEEIEQELIKLGYIDISKDVRRLIEYCLSAKNRINVLFNKLNPIFHDVEWYCSGDISKESLIKALEQYRKGE